MDIFGAHSLKTSKPFSHPSVISRIPAIYAVSMDMVLLTRSVSAAEVDWFKWVRSNVFPPAQLSLTTNEEDCHHLKLNNNIDTSHLQTCPFQQLREMQTAQYGTGRDCQSSIFPSFVPSRRVKSLHVGLLVPRAVHSSDTQGRM